MNPGGDFGKRELSPALRNRFTEIWVDPITASYNLGLIQNLLKLISQIFYPLYAAINSQTMFYHNQFHA